MHHKATRPLMQVLRYSLIITVIKLTKMINFGLDTSFNISPEECRSYLSSVDMLLYVIFQCKFNPWSVDCTVRPWRTALLIAASGFKFELFSFCNLGDIHVKHMCNTFNCLLFPALALKPLQYESCWLLQLVDLWHKRDWWRAHSRLRPVLSNSEQLCPIDRAWWSGL